MTEKDIEINIEADSIRISGQQEMDAEPSEGYYHRRERTGGKFSKKMMLPYRISTDAATARLVNGVLLVTLPKAEEAKPQKITVNVA